MDNLATEMMKELKANCRRWFIVAVIELIVIFAITGLFIGYINQPVEETITYTQDADSQDNSSINQRIGE